MFATFCAPCNTYNNKQDGRRAKSRTSCVSHLLFAELCNGRERSVWVRQWLARREERGCFRWLNRVSQPGLVNFLW